MDKTIKLWDTSTGQEIRTIHGHGDRVQSVAFSPDGKMLASAGPDKTIRFWDIGTGNELFAINQLPQEVNCISFSPDGMYLAAGCGFKVHTRGEVRLWRVSDRTNIASYTHSEPVDVVTFSSDGTLLASAGLDETVKLRSIANGGEYAVLGRERGPFERPETGGPICSLVFAQNDTIVAAGTRFGNICLWNMQRREAKRIIKVGNSGGHVHIAVAPSSNVIAAGDGFGDLRLFDLNSGEELQTLKGRAYALKPLGFPVAL